MDASPRVHPLHPAVRLKDSIFNLDFPLGIHNLLHRLAHQFLILGMDQAQEPFEGHDFVRPKRE